MRTFNFSLFFIPVLRWGRRYYVKSTCCNVTYEIDQELGKRILRGEAVTLTENDLHISNESGASGVSRCPTCGYPTDRDFDYCPKCGRKL
jgi:rubrerythrin